MYKLTIEFKSNDELLSFVTTLGGIPTAAKVEPVKTEEVKAEAPVEKKTKKKESEVKGVAVPPVIEEEVKKPAFDRDAAVAKATETVQKLIAQGVAGPALADTLAKLYSEAGCRLGVKIGQLSDEELERFMPLFLKKAVELDPAHAPKKQEASFI